MDEQQQQQQQQQEHGQQWQLAADLFGTSSQ
jgi:hypothetical protein